MDGEHGGFTLRTPGHMWPGPPANIYSGVADRAALTARYVGNTETYYLAPAGAELSGSVYTQITDLENELNGLWTYDRREIKVEPAAVRAFALTVAARIGKSEPDLMNELRLIVSKHLPQATAAFQVRVREILAQQEEQ